MLNYTEIESKVRESTNDEPWGPTGPQLQDLAQSSYSYEHFPELMQMLWRRMFGESKANYRRIYKALIVLNYLLRNGTDRVVNNAREHVYELRSLENFQYVDEMGKDQGVNIRHRAKQTLEFIQDDVRVREERKKAKKNKDKYVGVDANSMLKGRGPSLGYVDQEEEEGNLSDSGVGKENNVVQNDDDTSPPPSLKLERFPSTPASAHSGKPSNPKSKIIVSKKIDLGAAADFAKQHEIQNEIQKTVPLTDSLVKSAPKPEDSLFDLVSSSSQPPAQTGLSKSDNTLLHDLFDSLSTIAPEQNLPSNSEENEFTEFADFSNFDSTSTKTIALDVDLLQGATESSKAFVEISTTDDFGDFKSAFGALSSNFISCKTNVPSGGLSDIADLFSSSSMPSPLFPPVQSAPVAHSNSNVNLLAGLQAQTSVPAAMNASFDSILIPQSANQSNLLPANLIKDQRPQSADASKSTFKSREINESWCSLTKNLNINLENLLENKGEKPKPSMNQLAACFAKK